MWDAEVSQVQLHIGFWPRTTVWLSGCLAHSVRRCQGFAVRLSDQGSGPSPTGTAENTTLKRATHGEGAVYSTSVYVSTYIELTY